jgi:hypothetical protein
MLSDDPACVRSLQFRVLCLGLLQDGEVWISVFLVKAGIVTESVRSAQCDAQAIIARTNVPDLRHQTRSLRN